MSRSRRQRKRDKDRKAFTRIDGKLHGLTARGKPYPVREHAEPFHEELEALRGKVAVLRQALAPFASPEVKLPGDPKPVRHTCPSKCRKRCRCEPDRPLPDGTHVALYVGTSHPLAAEDMPLRVADFQRAREAMA